MSNFFYQKIPMSFNSFIEAFRRPIVFPKIHGALPFLNGFSSKKTRQKSDERVKLFETLESRETEQKIENKE
jgi:hypothetical protein